MVNGTDERKNLESLALDNKEVEVSKPLGPLAKMLQVFQLS